MIKSLLRSVSQAGESLFPEYFEVDHDRFSEDPIASNLSWQVIWAENSNLDRDILISTTECVFKATKRGLTEVSILCLVLAWGILAILKFYSGDEKVLLIALIGIFFTWSASIAIDALLPISFNRLTGRARIKWREFELSKIYAIQVLRFCDTFNLPRHGQRNRCLAVEVNVVLSDGKRIRLLSKERVSSILVDVKDLSRFLGVPIWDRLKSPVRSYYGTV